MKKITYKGQEGYFIPDDEKKQLDRVLKPKIQKKD